jgi:YggT family protein
VNAALTVLDVLLGYLRPVVFVIAAVFFVVFAVDWLVRTRRISPFSPVARFFRRVVDPVIAPIERRVVRAGQLPSSAPWWALVAVVLAGILVLLGLEFVRNQIALAARGAAAGPGGAVRVVVSWLFAILRLALIVRVISSWFRLSEFSWWIRWAVVLTEPILRPLRRVIPPLAMIDLTPLIAWLLLGFLQSAVL